MAATFCGSENPTIVSGDKSLMKGYPEAEAMVAANAVLPEPGGPYKRILTSGVLVEVRTCSTNSCPVLSNSYRPSSGRFQTLERTYAYVNMRSVVDNPILNDLL
jgi:hypothetical protein